MSERVYQVVLAMDFSEDILSQIRAVSPRLEVRQYAPGKVPPEAYANADILYTVRDFPTPEQAPQLRWIQLNYAGADSALTHPIAQAKEVTLTTASGIHAETIANYCLMMMLAFHYQLPRMIRDQQIAHWPERPHDLYRPIDVRGRTLGIVGYGTIGRELARAASALGVRVLATKRDPKRPIESADEYSGGALGDPSGEIPERLYPPAALALMAKECDWLVVTAPLTEQTRRCVNADVLRAMKPDSVLINVARGALVDEAALIEALRHKQIAGAALDVFETEPLPADSPLWAMENVIISPHTAGNSANYHEKAAALFIENLRRFLDKKPLLNVVRKEDGY
jgi:phosphoglycerate dehydrogenase-like enzyme